MAIKNGGPKRGVDPQTTSDVEVLKTAPVIGTSLVKAVEAGTSRALARGAEIGEKKREIIESVRIERTGDVRHVGKEAASIVRNLERVVSGVDDSSTAGKRAWRRLARMWERVSSEYDRLGKVEAAFQPVVQEMKDFVSGMDVELARDEQAVYKYKEAYDGLVKLLFEYKELIAGIKEEIAEMEGSLQDDSLSEEDINRLQIVIRERKNILDTYEAEQYEIVKLIKNYELAIVKRLIQAVDKRRLAQAIAFMRPTAEVIVYTELDLAAGTGVIEGGVKLKTGVDKALARLTKDGTKRLIKGTQDSIDARYGVSQYDRQISQDAAKLKKLIESVGDLVEAAKARRQSSVDEIQDRLSAHPEILQAGDFEVLLDTADTEAGQKLKELVSRLSTTTEEDENEE